MDQVPALPIEVPSGSACRPYVESRSKEGVGSYSSRHCDPDKTRPACRPCSGVYERWWAARVAGDTSRRLSRQAAVHRRREGCSRVRSQWRSPLRRPRCSSNCPERLFFRIRVTTTVTCGAIRFIPLISRSRKGRATVANRLVQYGLICRYSIRFRPATISRNGSRLMVVVMVCMCATGAAVKRRGAEVVRANVKLTKTLTR
jgi:hypothetical protein